MDKIKLAVIGLGKMGLSHLSIAGAHPSIELVAAVDTATMVTDFLQKFSDIPCFNDTKKMLEQVTPDAVIIAVPTKYHAPLIQEFLEKNIHVFAEKPFTLNAADANRLTELAASKKLVNQVGYHNQFLGTFKELKKLLQIGASYVSRSMRYYGADPRFPEQVNAFATRVSGQLDDFSFSGEWVSKSTEANFPNDFIKKKGRLFFLKTGWQDPTNRTGLQLQFRRLENADYKGNFNSSDAVASLNYVPALTRQHTNLLANIYPHAVQPIGEIGGMADLFIRFKKNTPLGGKFGTRLDINYSIYHALDSTRVLTGEGFTSNRFFGFGKTKLFRDLNLSVDKRWSTSYKTVFTFINLFYNRSILQGGPYANVRASLMATDHYIKIKKKQQLRINAEHMWVNNDERNWAGLLLEWSLPSGLSIFFSDMTNYQSAKMHYYNTGLALSKNKQRIQLSVGQQRAGLLCVGGICRFVPSYKGFSLSYNLNL